MHNNDKVRLLEVVDEEVDHEDNEVTHVVAQRVEQVRRPLGVAVEQGEEVADVLVTVVTVT